LDGARTIRNGRVELRVAPTPARYLRITQTGQAPLSEWTIRELYVYVATGGEPTTPVDVDGAWLAQALGAARVRQLYADHGWASRVALADRSLSVRTSGSSVATRGVDSASFTVARPRS
jgi:hypothetical protein